MEILPVEGMGWIQPGDDLAALIVSAAPWLRDGDVLVVTSKIVSKAEGRLVDIPPSGAERDAARLEVLAAETARVVARRGSLHIVQTHHGFVMAAAGIDNSNVERDRLVLLPKDPDASARSLRLALLTRFGLDVAVIVSDTMGRTWRDGLTDVALGSAGIEPMLDHRGQTDPWGNDLRITQMAVADELAAAADLVKRKCDQVPVAVVRGYLSSTVEDAAGAVSLVRDIDEDMFSLGTAEAISLGLSQAAALPSPDAFGSGPTDAALPDFAATATTRFEVVAPVEGTPPGTAYVVLAFVDDPSSTAQVLSLGMDLQRLRAALAAVGLASTVVGLPVEEAPEGALAILAVGRPE